MLKTIKHIIIGWGKRHGFLPTSKAEIKLAELRMRECDRCPFSSESKVLKLIKGDATYEKILKCNQCKCPSYEKTIVVDEECPIKRW